MEEKFVEIDGNKIRYLESGSSKKTLVLVHGLGASSERWQYVLPFFESDFHVIVPDLIGFGYSDKPIADYTIDYFSNFLKSIILLFKIKAVFSSYYWLSYNHIVPIGMKFPSM